MLLKKNTNSKNEEKKKYSEEEKTKKPTRRFYLFILAVLLLIIIVVIVWLWFYFQKPTETQVSFSSAPPALEKKEKTYKRFDGRYVDFDYESDYEIKFHHKDPDKERVVLESAYLTSSVSETKKIALTVENLEGRTLAESANYNLRKTYAKKYQEEKYKAGGISGIVFSRQEDLYEKVIFIPREEYIVEIALTSLFLSEKDKLDVELEKIIQSLDFK